MKSTAISDKSQIPSFPISSIVPTVNDDRQVEPQQQQLLLAPSVNSSSASQKRKLRKDDDDDDVRVTTVRKKACKRQATDHDSSSNSIGSLPSFIPAEVKKTRFYKAEKRTDNKTTQQSNFQDCEPTNRGPSTSMIEQQQLPPSLEHQLQHPQQSIEGDVLTKLLVLQNKTLTTALEPPVRPRAAN